MGYKVIYSDIQYYSYALNKYYIENVPVPDASPLDILNSLEEIKGFIFKKYCADSGSNHNYFISNGKKKEGNSYGN